MNSPPLQFLLQLLRLSLGTDASATLQPFVSSATDLSAAAALAQAHGIFPLFYKSLKENCWDDLAVATKATLETTHRKNASHSLLLANELLRLAAMLQSQQIFFLPYKGPALAVQLYGDVGMRQYGDLDVVIHKQDWAQVHSLLLANHWLTKQEFPAVQEDLYQYTFNEHAYLSAARDTLLELHWAFAEPRYCFPFPTTIFAERATTVNVLGTEVAAPLPPDLLLILCFHGAKHKWERLGWIADIARLIVATPALDWERVQQQAQTLACQRMLHLSLQLVVTLLGVRLPAEILQPMQADQAAQKLAAQIVTRIKSGVTDEVGMWALLRFHLQMREGWRERFLYCYHLIFRTTPQDWAMLPFVFPAGLSFLYYPARLVRLLRKHILRENI